MNIIKETPEDRFKYRGIWESIAPFLEHSVTH